MPKDYGDVGSDDGDDVPHDGDLDDIPAEPQANGDTRKESTANTEPEELDSASGDDDDDDDGEEFQVEAIVKHSGGKGQEILYNVKWVGYPASENTWEPAVNLLPNAQVILSKYHEEHENDASLKKSLKKSKSTTSLKKDSSLDGTPPPSKKRKTEDDGSWVPKKNIWNDDVTRVETIERGEDGQLYVFILFRNGKKSKVSMDMVKRHCAVPMLEFYEAHLKFKSESEINI